MSFWLWTFVVRYRNTCSVWRQWMASGWQNSAQCSTASNTLEGLDRWDWSTSIDTLFPPRFLFFDMTSLLYCIFLRRTAEGPRRKSLIWRRKCHWLSSSCVLGKMNRRGRVLWAVQGTFIFYTRSPAHGGDFAGRSFHLKMAACGFFKTLIIRFEKQ